jgi:predicted enzyme related to lactoylglutathione lyase
MPNIGYFEIPADDVGRAKKFYSSLLGWEISPTGMPGSVSPEMEYQDVKCGEPKEGTLSMGGMYRRQMPGSPIIIYAMVEDIDRVLSRVEKLGGKIRVPKMKVEGVGEVAVLGDPEGNGFGVWEPRMD